MRVNIGRDKKVAFHPVNAHRMKNYETIPTPLNPSSHRLDSSFLSSFSLTKKHTPSSKPKIKVLFILHPYHFDGSLSAI